MATELDDDELPPPAPVEANVGEVIDGKYRLERLLGRGGMGTVWLATHLGLGDRVAIKIMSRKMADNDEVRARFGREARASAKIKSRYVARVYDNGELPDRRPFLVMEFMEGETLAQTLRRVRTFSLADAARILMQVGRGLARAHELGIVHRDVKPENIFLAHTAEDGVIAKVFDFGIVKVADLHVNDDATQEGCLLGTPQYMSPEQVDGRPVDLRSDVYSLGVVAFRMLTGRRLFAGESLSAVLIAICSSPLPSLSTLVPDLSPAVDAWFHRACARDRDARYASALECVQALATAAGLRAEAGDFSLTTGAGVVAPSLSPGGASNGPPADTGSGLSSPLRPPATALPSPQAGGSVRPSAEEEATLPSKRKKVVGVAVAVGAALIGAFAFVTATRSSSSGADLATAASTAQPRAAPDPPAPAASSAPAPGAAPATSAPTLAAAPSPDAAAEPPSIARSPAPRRAGPSPRATPPPREAKPPTDKGADDRIHDVGY